ncbi:hypothetical protein HUB98_10285 [Paenibacillus barcinonensis]|uniref:Uncharacterized protein n=1 Tax=Paenibacillus barcinonensis TaxID=198119 RepID=A0A2V4VSL2_PAEBA|nr:hypothetical protein [Paenibacillus barcinonensis]PYE49599.1 hypothetical protein DFQ00_105102 [Paenibacillus barcinonensis]QKS56685.1 hypothetical protein HUB98_10285 [Paenibacillus barcinonensis]
MFDPTIYDNLKVAIENYIYDLDNLDERIHVTHRRDQLDMASMSRVFTLQFCLREKAGITAELVLKSALEDTAAEILETPGSQPGCGLELRFALVTTKQPELLCPDIQAIMQEYWPSQRTLQRIHYTFGETPASFNVASSVYFDRKVNEDQMQDMPELCHHMLHVLHRLGIMEK